MAEQLQHKGVSPALQVLRKQASKQQSPAKLPTQIPEQTEQAEAQLAGFLDVVGRVAKRVGNALVGGATDAKNNVVASFWDSASPSFGKVTSTGGAALAQQGVSASGVAAWKNALDIAGVGLAVCHDSINDPNPDKDLALGQEFMRALKATQPNNSLVTLRQMANKAAKAVYVAHKGQVLFSKAESKQMAQKFVKATSVDILGSLRISIPGMDESYYGTIVQRLTGYAEPAPVRDPAGWPQREKVRQDKEASVKKELKDAISALDKQKAQAKLDALVLKQTQNVLYQQIAEKKQQSLSLQETAYQQQQELALQAEQLRQQALQTQEDLEAQQALLQRRQAKTQKGAGIVLGLVGLGAILYVFLSHSVDKGRSAR